MFARIGSVIAFRLRLGFVYFSLFAAVLCWCLLSPPARAATKPSIPDTPAGHTLSAWLDAFDSGNGAKLAAFNKRFDPSPSFPTSVDFQTSTGGMDLLTIERSEPRLIKFRVKEKLSANVALGTLQVSDGDPATVKSFSLRLLPPGTALNDIQLDSAERHRVIAGIIAALDQGYIYLDVAHKMDAVLEANEKNGTYNSITDGGTFAAMLLDEMQSVSHDHQLFVDYAPYKLPQHLDPPEPADEARFRKQMEQHNCAFDKAEVLPGNIGYVKLDAFPPPDICAPTVFSARGFLSHVDAIIFDLRENHGGDPAMVQFLASYLFTEHTHLNDLYYRRDNSTTQYWTLPYVPGTRLGTQPAFVLTSHQTFSGGEEFTNDLKTQKRATIVGETTGGGAHPVGGVRIDDHFVLGVPGGRPINPITKTDWEGTGVTPDVSVPAADALETAKKLAMAKIAAGNPAAK